MDNVFLKDFQRKPRAGIFLSGNGSNVRALLEHVRILGDRAPWVPAVIVTDRPKSSAAESLAKEFQLPFVGVGISAFYRKHGLESTSMATPRGREVRELWTNELRAAIAPYKLDFGILAGFVSLSNIVGDMPCLNVHPGDLTVERDGRRYLVGLHTVPVELAILAGFSTLRSSVILVRPYGEGAGVDAGYLLGISEPVGVDLQGHSVEELQIIFRSRKGPHLHGVNHDLLSELAQFNQEKLKREGDLKIYPRVVDDFTRGCFGNDPCGNLLWRETPLDPFQKIRTIEYGVVRRLLKQE